MEPYLKGWYANPSSIHAPGRLVAKAVKQARRQVAAMLSCSDEKEIVFTSGGTESNNAAIRSCLALQPDKRDIVISSIEHSSISKLCKQLEKEGYRVHRIAVDSKGSLDLDELKGAISDQTALVTIMMANNETGIFLQSEEIGGIVKERGVFYHVDAVQAAGKETICLKDSTVDLLSLSAHKFYGPKGIGVLFVKRDAPYQSLIFGGSQERGRRAGTENVPGIVGMGAAAAWVNRNLESEKVNLIRLREEFENQVQSLIPDVTIHGAQSRRLCNTSNVRFIHVDGEALLFDLDQKGICASSGSACMSGAREPSPVLKAMGLSDAEANGSIRFSFGHGTTTDEIKEAVPVIAESVHRLREIELEEQHAALHRP